MEYVIGYCSEYQRVIPAILKECRGTIPAISTKIGTVIKAFQDWQLSEVGPNVLPYRIETTKGNLVGYFTLRVETDKPEVTQKAIRPSFGKYIEEIEKKINIFISSREYAKDHLY